MPKSALPFVAAAALALAGEGCAAPAPRRIDLRAADGLPLAADLYAPLPKAAPFILLCHRAGWSRGEYREIAPWLNSLGFNCLALDQRSGGEVNGVANLSYAAAAALPSAGTRYIDALPDIRAGLAWISAHYEPAALLLWGSSYSSALAFPVAAEAAATVDGVVAFSPGEYFADQGKGPHWVAEAAARLRVPAFIASSRAERWEAEPIALALPAGSGVFFVDPEGAVHGAEALWAASPRSAAYREAVAAFLARFLPPAR
jgi:alpha-beta hydrolase superfamily lysophospholipase